MKRLVIFKVLGLMLMLLSVTQLPPVLVGFIYKDGGILSFVFGFVITFFFGFFLWFFSRHSKTELKTRDGFLVVTLMWVVLSAFSAIPFLITLYPNIPVTDAVFEAVSGLTTTGATVLSNLQDIPHAILYYRQQLQFLGGIGIIVLAIAVMPMLGVGGMRLYRAEMAGPMKSDKLTPRLAQTAKALWSIYVGIALLGVLAFHFAGMKWFDAVAASFSSVSTGGFFIHDSSLIFYHNAVIDSIAIVLMLLGGINFALHFKYLHQRHLRVYFKDPEFKFFISLYAVVSLIVFLVLFHYGNHSVGQNVLNAIFTVVALGTTTGLVTTDFNSWPTFLPYLVTLLALVGGCAGSTTGGIKMIRPLVLREQMRCEFYRLIHPKGVFSVKLGAQTVSERTVQAVWGFVTLFLMIYLFLFLILLATGLDVKTTFGVLSGTLANAGVGIGNIFAGYGQLSGGVKWVCIFAMILGRLEIFTVMVLFLPSYWRT